MPSFGNIKIGMPMALAPMAGVTNVPFRRICREFAERASHELGVYNNPDSSIKAPTGIYVCEMITARALVEQRKTTLSLVKPDPEDPCHSVQLHGVDPATMGQAAKILVQRNLADHIDINFGCPVPKVTRKGGGSALPWKLGHFTKIVQAVVEEAKEIPVTIKIRIGIDDEHETAISAAQAAESVGVAGVMLHARTASQYYSGSAQWEHITALVRAVNIPVWGNGDIFSPEDAQQMMKKTGCAGVEIGRGCQGRPWLFYDLACAFNDSDRRLKPNLGQVVEIIIDHAELLASWSGDEIHALKDMRKHIGWYLRGFSVGGELRGHLARVKNLKELAILLGELDLSQSYPQAAEGRRGRAGNPRKTHLPHRWLETRDIDEDARKILVAAEMDTFLDNGGY